jgi:hypothetical protein
MPPNLTPRFCHQNPMFYGHISWYPLYYAWLYLVWFYSQDSVESAKAGRYVIFIFFIAGTFAAVVEVRPCRAGLGLVATEDCVNETVGWDRDRCGSTGIDPSCRRR